jgi:hypothetical protein
MKRWQELCWADERSAKAIKAEADPPPPRTYASGAIAPLPPPLATLACYVWKITHRLWNKAIHALIGNTSSDSIIRKLFTQGMPVLREGSLSPRDFLSFRIDLEGWAGAQGITPLIIGPLPAAPATDPTRPDLQQNYDDRVSQGMRYVCAAVQDTNLRASMASQATAQSGPACLKWLSTEILQSQAEQPSLQHIIDSMTLKPSESIIGFKAIFCKFLLALRPQPAPETSCSKFIDAVTKDTAGFFDDCVTAALSSTDQSDFAVFASKLILLCSNKFERSDQSANSPTALIIELQALKAEVLTLQQQQSYQKANNNRQRHDSQDGNHSYPDEHANDEVDPEKDFEFSDLLCVEIIEDTPLGNKII